MNYNMHVNSLIIRILVIVHEVKILLFIMIQECLFIFGYLFIGTPITELCIK